MRRPVNPPGPTPTTMPSRSPTRHARRRTSSPCPPRSTRRPRSGSRRQPELGDRLIPGHQGQARARGGGVEREGRQPGGRRRSGARRPGRRQQYQPPVPAPRAAVPPPDGPAGRAAEDRVGPLHEGHRVRRRRPRSSEPRLLVVRAAQAVGVHVRHRHPPRVALGDREGRARDRPLDARGPGRPPAPAWSCPPPARRAAAPGRRAASSAGQARRPGAVVSSGPAALGQVSGRAQNRPSCSSARPGAGDRAGSGATARRPRARGRPAPARRRRGSPAEQLGDAGEVRLEGGEHRRRVEGRRRVVERVEQHRQAADLRCGSSWPCTRRDAVGPPGQQLGGEVAEGAHHARAG